MHTRVCQNACQYRRSVYIRRGLRVVSSKIQGNARAATRGTDDNRTPRFLYY